MKKVVFLLILLVLFCCLSRVAEADENYAQIMRLKGRVIILRAGATEWIKAEPEMQLFMDDRIKTGGWGSYAELSFSEDAKQVIKINENTEMTIKELYPKVAINLDRGRIYSLIESLEDKSSFEVRTSSAICGARGTGWEVKCNPHTTAKCFENQIYVQGLDEEGNLMHGELIVEKGFKTIVEQNKKPEKLVEITMEDKQGWNYWKEDLDDFFREGGLERLDIERLDKAGGHQESFESTIGARESFFEIRDLERIEARIETETPIPEGTTTTPSPSGTTGGERELRDPPHIDF